MDDILPDHDHFHVDIITVNPALRQTLKQAKSSDASGAGWFAKLLCRLTN